MKKYGFTSTSIIFNEEPVQWGLRGDRYLWRDLKQFFLTIPLTISNEDFEKEFKRLFKKLTGSTLIDKKYIFVAKYSHGGMSSGMISTKFWMEKGLPLLLKRLDEYKKVMQ